MSKITKLALPLVAAIAASMSFSNSADAAQWRHGHGHGHHHGYHHGHHHGHYHGGWHGGFWGPGIVFAPGLYAGGYYGGSCYVKKVRRHDHNGHVYVKRIRVCD